MDILLFRFHIFLLFIISTIETTAASDNDTALDDPRKPRVTGRIVKLYSGTKPEPFLCAGEGFQADLHDCSVFYRCVRSGNGKYTVFRFQCGPGTVYDPETEVCNHPQSTKRAECGGSLPSFIDRDNTNEIDGTQQEIPSPMTTKRPIYAEETTTHKTTLHDHKPQTSSVTSISKTETYTDVPAYPHTSSTAYYSTPFSDATKTTAAPVTTTVWKPGTEDEDNICTHDGFMGDSKNCRKFYRCVANQRGGYIRYEFSCSELTVWDNDVQGCNHAWAVKRSKCGGNNYIIKDQEQVKPTQIPTASNQPVQQQLQISYGPNVTQTQMQISNGSTIQNQTQINYGDRVEPNKGFNSKQNQTQISHGTAVSQSQTQIDYGNKGVQTQLQIDHSEQSSQIQTQIYETTTQRNVVSHGSTEICTQSGFVGDSNDCKKFYRCIDNGRGRYTKFEFSCGEGTVWDSKSEGCNHAWAVKECGGRFPAKTTTQVPISSTYKTTQMYDITKSPENNYGGYNNEDMGSGNLNQQLTTILPSTEFKPSITISNEDVGYGNQNQEHTTVFSTTVVSTPGNSNGVGTDCSSSGFMGDEYDCRIFYRCIENGKGFTKYEFKCGEGTVWDPEIEACNHAWAVKKCGGSATSDINKIESTTLKQTEQTTFTQNVAITTTAKPVSVDIHDYDMDSGYGSQDNVFSSFTSSTTQTQSIGNNVGNICKSSGFMGDENDCKRFYRCVDSGSGSFIRYEYMCGEGTVWDPEIEACNHLWAVKKCGGSVTTDTNVEPSTTIKQAVEHTTFTSNVAVTTTMKPVSIDNNDYDTGYGFQDNNLSSTTMQTHNTGNTASNICKSSGFMGDEYDCNKFYRCVDNGDGSFIKYEFTCGEGTVWDPDIDACNHAWAVKKCGGSASTDINKMESTTNKYTTEHNTIIPNVITTTIKPVSSGDDGNDAGYGSQNTNFSSSTSTTMQTQGASGINIDDVCKSSGFIGDKKDCKKFYRCVDSGDGSFTRYEFSCGEGTVWDTEIEACNHAWAVKQCGGSKPDTEYSEESTTQSSSTYDMQSGSMDSSVSSAMSTVTHSTITSTSLMTETISLNDNTKCVHSGFMGDSEDCKKFYRCVDDGNGHFIKYEFTCGEGTYWNQDIVSCDHATSDKPCGDKNNAMFTTKVPQYHDESQIVTATDSSSSSVIVTSESSVAVSSETPQSSGICYSEGFYGDPDDCKRFYRCVDNGKGGYTKYDFACGEGTVWDQEIQSCNHESTTNKCFSGATSNNLQSSTAQSEISGSSTSSASSTEVQYSTDKAETSTTLDNLCTSEGFFAHPQDCKKFIRCVNNEKGGYTKYEFACGEGTIWVQDILACDHDDGDTNCSTQQSTTQTHINEVQQPTSEQTDITVKPTAKPTAITTTTDKLEEEYENTNSNTPSGSNKCTSEGFHPDSSDCKKFYQCVDNGQGGYTKYEHICGDGTAWDIDIQACNHINQVKKCYDKSDVSTATQTVIHDEGNNQTTESSSSYSDSSTSPASSSSTTHSPDSSQNSESSESCKEEGFFGDTKDCKKFYRCVDNGKGGYTKYHFDCGEGTIWDQDVTTCNHPQDVANPSCGQNQGGGSTTTSSSSSSSSTHSPSSSESNTQSTASTSSSSQSTTESSTQSSNCSQEESSKKPANEGVNCTKEGYYPNPNDCKKYYRCVDWNGDGTKFSVYHFECGEGTIWDPALDTCNHEESVYPPRDCSGTQSQNETLQTTTTEGSTTEKEDTTNSQTTSQTTEETTTQSPTTEQTTTQQPDTTEQTTTQQSTSTEQTTTQESTTSEQTTTQQTTTSDQTTTQQSTTSEQTTTQKSSSSETTTQQLTTSEQTTTQESTTSEPTTTQQSTTSEQTTTQQSTTSEQTTTQSSSEVTTLESSTTDQSTQESTTEGTTQSNTDKSTTSESTSTEGGTSTTTNQSTDETSATEGNTDQSTTEQSGSTTEQATETTTSGGDQEPTEGNSSEKECPDTDDDQNLFVCPTSFRRHPKYCNMFYQCTEDDSHDVKIATFTCPNNTIYDESQTKCVDESEADKKCEGEKAQVRRFKRLKQDYKDPIVVTKHSYACRSPGYYTFEKDSECSPAFLKCKTDKSKLRGYVYQCPVGYYFWSISRRCEPLDKIKDCKRSYNDWSGRWEIPVERRNVAAYKIKK